MKRFSVGVAMALGGALSAFAQTPPAPAPVESLSCEQMYAEVMTAGQTMSRQLDPSVGAQAQDRLRQATGPGAYAAAAADQARLSALCSNPLTPAACKAAQSEFVARQQAAAAASQQQMADLHAKVQASTAGIDMERMQAIQTRIDKERCPQPKGPGG